MDRKRVDAVTGDSQPPLVPLSPEEIAEHQAMLPPPIGELESMKTVHAGRRAEMKNERSDLQDRINNIAQQLREAGR